MAAADLIDGYVRTLPGEARRLDHREWGLTVPAEQAGGWPLDIGVRLVDGLVRAQAFAVPAEPRLDFGQLLHWNRQTRLVRFACTRSGDIWVQGEVPVAGLDEGGFDRLLGLLVEGALAARDYAARATAPG
jgi:hypothetical protein